MVLISSIKLHKSNHLCSVLIFVSFHISLSSLSERLDIFSQACLIHVVLTSRQYKLTSFANARGSITAWGIRFDFSFSGLSHYSNCDSFRSWGGGRGGLCLAHRLLSSSFVPLQRSRQLTHSLQNALRFLCEGSDCLLFVFSEKETAASHPLYLFSKMRLLISCRCTLVYTLMACFCARLQLLKTSGG